MATDASPGWLRNDLFRGMPHFITPAWVQDRPLFDAAAVAEAWKKIGFTVVHLLTKHSDGFMLFPSDHCPRNQPDIDYFGLQVEECVKRDIKVIAYHCVGFDNWAGSQHPEWLVQDQDGGLPDTSLWHLDQPLWMCLSSGYMDYVLALLDELAEKYEINGFWLDICGLPVDPDYCFCDNCRRGYSDRIGAINLDNLKGSEEHWQYKLHLHREIVRKSREVLRAHGRDPVLIYNGAGTPYHKRYVLGSESYDSQSDECHDPILLGTIGRIARNSDKPSELLSCSEVTWGHPILKPDTLVELEAFAAMAHGCTYTMGITHSPLGGLSPGNIERLARINRKIQDHREVLVDTEPVYDVGVVSSADNREMRRVKPQVWRWVDILRQGHFLFNILHGFDNLDAQRVVVIPGGLRISEADATSLREYVAGGGNLIVESPTPHRHEDGPYLLEDLLGVKYEGLSAADLHYLDPLPEALRKDGMTHDVLMMPTTADRVTLDGAELIASLVHQFVPRDRGHSVWSQANMPEPEPTGEPGVTLNRVGKGRVAFVVGQISAREPEDDTSPWLATLAQNLVDLLLQGRTLELAAGPLLEVVANRKDDRIIVHLLNHAYSPSPALRSGLHGIPDAPAPMASTVVHSRGEVDRLAPLTIRLDTRRLGMRLTRVSIVSGAEPLELRIDGDSVEFTTAPLAVHQTIVLE